MKMVSLTRRRVLLRGAALGGLVLGSRRFRAVPAVYAAGPVTLRIAGTGVNQFKELADKAREELGFTIQYTSLVSDDVVKRAVTQPSSFDLLDSEYWMLKKIVPSGNLQGIDVKKIEYYDQIVPIFTQGKLPDGKPVATEGISPLKVAYLTAAKSKDFANTPSEWMTVIPTVYNADTLGVRPDLIKNPVNSWAQLLAPEFKGKAAILDIPSIGIMDAAMASEATGKVKYKDKGNMTVAEIDQTIAIMTEAKKAGQFRAFWKDFNESVNLMASGEVLIQSMWSPAVTKVRQMGVACKYQPLKEGYRAWAAGLGVPAHLNGKMLDAAYEFINWYLSGWVGAFLNRQGYYTAVLDTAKKFMTADEWDYWMEGKPANSDIVSPTGEKIEKAGAVRDGGSFYERIGHVAVWNTVMDQDRYMVRKWNEFIAA
ncbi:MAG: extracellular solute-binding protein [Alphaproteobacteria bacterium]|nr:extracellular solute-binding protein [Alphaproteobacteria bacterium]